jgi:DNA invertase Pin-like site-specific DNA recombinase
MNKYITYFRVSTKEQGQSGLGLAAQEQMVLPITNTGIVVASFTEVESGNKSNRKELEKAINACKQNNATLLVAKLDRLSRNVHFISTLMESKVQFKCADAPEMDSFTVHIFSALAERERKMISERTSKALQVIKARIATDGEYTTKAGRVISTLGNGLLQNKETAKKQMAYVASHRVYQKKSNIGLALVQSLSQNGVPKKDIKQKLADNGINVSLQTIYKYAK